MPIIYIGMVFLVMPGVLLCIALAFYSSAVLGIVLVTAVLAVLAVFEFWWWRGFGTGPGAFKVLSEEERQKGRKELLRAMVAVTGKSEDQCDRDANTLDWWGN